MSDQPSNRPTLFIGIAGIVLGFGTLLIGFAALNLQNVQTSIQAEQTQIQRQQSLLENYTFSKEHFPIRVSAIGTDAISIQNQTYKNYPIFVTLSFSTISPDYLRFEINNAWLRFSDPCTFEFPPVVSINGTIEKFVDKGISNENFEIPLILDYVPKVIPREQLSDEKLVSTPIFLNVTAFDEQNKTEPPVFHSLVISSLHIIDGQHFAKKPC